MTHLGKLAAIAAMVSVPPTPIEYHPHIPTKAERIAKEQKRAERKAERQRKKKARRDSR